MKHWKADIEARLRDYRFPFRLERLWAGHVGKFSLDFGLALLPYYTRKQFCFIHSLALSIPWEEKKKTFLFLLSAAAADTRYAKRTCGVQKTWKKESWDMRTLWEAKRSRKKQWTETQAWVEWLTILRRNREQDTDDRDKRDKSEYAHDMLGQMNRVGENKYEGEENERGKGFIDFDSGWT